MTCSFLFVTTRKFVIKTLTATASTFSEFSVRLVVVSLTCVGVSSLQRFGVAKKSKNRLKNIPLAARFQEGFD